MKENEIRSIGLGVIREINSAMNRFEMAGGHHPNVLLLGILADQALFSYFQDTIPEFGRNLSAPASCEGMQYRGANIAVRRFKRNSVEFLHDPVVEVDWEAEAQAVSPEAFI